jgi:hypothetical protein
MARQVRLRYIRRMDRDALVRFARARGLAVLATMSADGHVRIHPDWGRYSDYRPETFGTQEIPLS